MKLPWIVRRILGSKTMTKILVGQKAPGFSLRNASGQAFSLQEALHQGPVVAAFFKISCPVCQFTFPFLERLYKNYGGKNAAFWGISQDDARDTKEFCSEYGVTFPALLDEGGYPVSNLYGLTNVPTFFLIDTDGTVKVSCVGFGKSEIEQIASALAAKQNRAPAPVFLPNEVVPANKPG
jgi:peroxiredoxin